MTGVATGLPPRPRLPFDFPMSGPRGRRLDIGISSYFVGWADD